MYKSASQTTAPTQQPDNEGSPSRRVFVILNPMAGNSRPPVVHEALDEYLEAGKYEVYETTGRENLPDIVAGALERGFNFFVAAGGDGTVSGVADALLDTHLPLGILPAGTVNTLARELGIPLDIKEAAALFSNAITIRHIDAMRVGSQLFLLGVSVGVSSLTIRETDRQRERKRLLGILAYLWAGLKHLIGLQPESFKLTVDGQEIQVQAKEIVITNARIFGLELFHWGPHIRIDDGRLDICVVRARNLVHYILLAWNLLWGRQTRNPELRYLEVNQQVRVEADGSLPVQGDGEFIGRPPLEIEVLPAALQIVAPANNNGG